MSPQTCFPDVIWDGCKQLLVRASWRTAGTGRFELKIHTPKLAPSLKTIKKQISSYFMLEKLSPRQVCQLFYLSFPDFALLRFYRLVTCTFSARRRTYRVPRLLIKMPLSQLAATPSHAPPPWLCISPVINSQRRERKSDEPRTADLKVETNSRAFISCSCSQQGEEGTSCRKDCKADWTNCQSKT